MASPHVCGVAALMLSTGTPAESIRDQLVADATQNQIDLEDSCFNDACRNSPNKLVFNGCAHTTAKRNH